MKTINLFNFKSFSFLLVILIGAHNISSAQDSLIDKSGYVYKGGIKKGRKDGYGTLYMKTTTGKDSLVTGYWKHDQFMGIYEYPFKMLGKTFMVSNVQISYEQATPPNNTIEISMESVSGGAFNVHGEIPKPTLTDVVFQRGSYQLMMPITNQQKRNTYIFQNVIFPASVLFKMGPEEVQIEFNAEKNYKVFINTRD